MKSILLVCDLEHVKNYFKLNLANHYDVTHSYTLDFEIEVPKTSYFDYIFIDLQLLNLFKKNSNKSSYTDLISPIRQRFPTAILVIMSDSNKSQDAVRAIKSGADNYFNYPLSKDEIDFVLENETKIQENNAELTIFKDEFWKEFENFTLQTKSPHFKDVIKQIETVAATKSTVLLTGETGTGKGVIAKILHKKSQRHKSKYVQVHCGSIPSSLIESELFGHEKGAFTGAERKKLGKFELAHGGTVFLDEIGTITKQVQISLLKVLQERSFSRVGGEKEVFTDIRIIAATNEDLLELSNHNEFRKDLYYRLNVFPIRLPSLRERLEDIPHLVDHFIKRFNLEHQKYIEGVADGFIEVLQMYDWPGNIRELENIIERAYILEKSSYLTPEALPLELLHTPEVPTATISLPDSQSLADARKMAIESFERNYLKQLLLDNDGKINLSAQQAQVTTRQLHKLLLKHHIDKKEFKTKK